MSVAQRTVDLARTLRSANRLKTRQPLAHAWVAAPDRGSAMDAELLRIVADEINVRIVEPMADGSDLIERRIKVLLPRVGKRLGSAIPAVMAAARDGRVAFHDDGSVTIADQVLNADEVEIQATPRPGTAVAEDDGLVLVLDTELTPDLRAEGDVRELGRAIQDLRREAGLELDDRIELWVQGLQERAQPYLGGVLADTLATLMPGTPPADVQRGAIEVDDGRVDFSLRRRAGPA